MSKALVVISALLVIAILAIIGLIAGIIPWSTRGGRTSTPATVPGPAPSTTPSTPTTPLPPTTSPMAKAPDVRFEFAVTNVSGSGLTRTITAQVTNVGTADAHNVWGKVEASSQGSRVSLSGQDSLRVDIGTIVAGKTATTQVTINFSLADGLKVTQNGATFTLTIYSDENTGTFNYSYAP